MELCKSCRFFKAVSDQHGQCRKEPPSATLVPVEGIGGRGLSTVSYWGEVKTDDWCGQHVPGFGGEQGSLKLA